MLETQKKSRQNTDNHQQNQKKRPRNSYLLSLRTWETLIPVLTLHSSSLRSRGARGGGIWGWRESQERANPINRQRWDTEPAGRQGQQPVVRREVQREWRWEQGCMQLCLPSLFLGRAAAVGALWHKNDKNSTGLQSSAVEGKTKPATLPFSPNQTLLFPYLQPFKGEGFRYLLWGWWGSQWRAPRDLDPQHGCTCTSGSLGKTQTSVCSCSEQMITS